MVKKDNQYCENNKERLQTKVRNKYREFPNKETDTKREYGSNQYKDMSEEDNQKLKRYKKNYDDAKKVIQ